MSKKDVEMSDAVDQLPRAVGGRVGRFLRTEWPRHTTKLAADTFGVHPTTAKQWVGGAMPANRHFLAMIHRWQSRFVASALEPTGDWTKELAATRADLAETRERYQRLIHTIDQLLDDG